MAKKCLNFVANQEKDIVEFLKLYSPSKFCEIMALCPNQIVETQNTISISEGGKVIFMNVKISY